MKANPAKSFKIGALLITPKYYTVFDSILKSDNDTLVVEAESTYVHFPFGVFKTNSKIDSGLLKNFQVQGKIIKTDIGDLDFKTVIHGSSKLMFWNNTTTPFKEYDLVKGEINDPDVQFVNGIKAGMNINDFYMAFFDRFPDNLRNKYKYFIIKTINEVQHIYYFEHNRLKSVKFKSVTYIDPDY